ncbi:hypothetical protein LUZ60_014301 [Juncus effusus]|nr:hypothetical protein LUZ60_014301 [Juncus effusus]
MASPSPVRLWRKPAQANIHNQWSNLFAARKRWVSAASEGRKHATELINAFLSQKYVPVMDLGVLKDMPNIHEKACKKLSYKQDLYEKKLVSSYKEMVTAVSQMVKASKSMRFFIKSSSIGSPIVKFSNHAEVSDDYGDGGGIPVFKCYSVSDFENLAEKFVEMFILELVLKRLIVVELISIKLKEPDKSRWSNEIFEGEFNELKSFDLISEENFELSPPKLKDLPNDSSFLDLSNYSATENVLQVYLTTWLANVNIYTSWVDETVRIMEEEIGAKFS